MIEYVVRETEDYFTLSIFFRENGLGVHIEQKKPERVLRMWRMDDAQTGEMLAAATLELRGGVAALGDIAVQDKVRGNGCGTVMLHTVIEEAQRRGVETLWACAKEPDFYLHRGWQTADWDASPDIAAYCSTCEKKDSLCHPKQMKLSLIR